MCFHSRVQKNCSFIRPNGSTLATLASLLLIPQNTGQNTVLCHCSTFSRAYTFFLLTSSSFLFSNSSHRCFSIFPYSRKFDFETSFDHLPIKRGNSISLYMEVLAGKASMHGACSSKPCLITGTYEELRMTQHLWVSIPEAIPAGSVSALFRRQRGLLVCTTFRGLKVNWHSCLGQVDSKQ